MVEKREKARVVTLRLLVWRLGNDVMSLTNQLMFECCETAH